MEHEMTHSQKNALFTRLAQDILHAELEGDCPNFQAYVEKAIEAFSKDDKKKPMTSAWAQEEKTGHRNYLKMAQALLATLTKLSHGGIMDKPDVKILQNGLLVLAGAAKLHSGYEAKILDPEKSPLYFTSGKPEVEALQGQLLKVADLFRQFEAPLVLELNSPVWDRGRS